MLPSILLTLAALLPQDAPAGKGTVRYKDLDQIVQMIAAEAESEEKAIVIWIVDNASSLKAQDQGALLSDAIRRSFRKAGVRHAVAVLEEVPRLHLKLTEGAEAAAKAIEALAAGPPDDAIKNCLLAVREGAKMAASVSGRIPKYVVLFTQDNADSEDNLEATVRLLKSLKVTFIGIVPEAVYSDPYWASAISESSYYFSIEKIKKLPFELKGPESAFVEFPYGWPFTWIDPSYTVPSGFGAYAVGRLAAETGGKVFLHNPRRTETPFCMRYGCIFCGGRHQVCGADFNEAKLALVPPDLGPRAEYGSRYGREPLCLEMIAAWNRLHQEGILRGVPPLRPSGGGLVDNRQKARSSPRIQISKGRADGQAALKAASETGKAAAALAAAIKRYGKKADLRVKATADALVIHLLLLEQSYRQLAFFFEEAERVARLKAGEGDGFTSSPLTLGPGDRLLDYTSRGVFLCHGGAALKEMGFLGDRKGLHEALNLADQLIAEHRGTPWEVLIRRASVSLFTPIIETPEMRAARERALGERPHSGSTSRGEETPGTPQRPQRPVRGTEGGSSGTGTRTGDP